MRVVAPGRNRAAGLQHLRDENVDAVIERVGRRERVFLFYSQPSNAEAVVGEVLRPDT
jgi:hypothetical protein